MQAGIYTPQVPSSSPSPIGNTTKSLQTPCLTIPSFPTASLPVRTSHKTTKILPPIRLDEGFQRWNRNTHYTYSLTRSHTSEVPIAGTDGAVCKVARGKSDVSDYEYIAYELLSDGRAKTSIPCVSVPLELMPRRWISLPLPTPK